VGQASRLSLNDGQDARLTWNIGPYALRLLRAASRGTRNDTLPRVIKLTRPERMLY